MPRHLALLILLAAFLASCGRTAEPEPDFVFISSEEHNFLDPQKISWSHDIRVADCLYEPLLHYKLPELVLVPAAAERWEISDDGRTYTFHLREGARWNNGDPLRASDFAYAWRRALLPDLAADYTELLFRIDGAEAFFHWRAEQIAAYVKLKRPDTAAAAQLWREAQDKFKQTVAIQAPDERTLVVRLARPTPYFLELCAFITFAPVHAASVAATEAVDPDSGMLTGDSTYWSDPRRLVTNGPYTLHRRRFKRDLLMVRNERYWNAAAMGNRSILERVVSDPRTAMMVYTTGHADWLPDVPTTSSMAADLVGQHRRDVTTVISAGTYFYNFNCQPKLADGSNNPLANARVRLALSLGIDRKTIVDHVTRLHQPTAATFIPPGALPGYEPPAESGASFSPERARKLLEEAGFPGGKGLSGLSILFNTNAGHEAIAQQIKRSWEENLGVVVTLEGLEGKGFSERLKGRQYTIARASWFGDYRDATTFLDKFRATNGNNDAGYANPQFDALMNAADEEQDVARRLELMREAESLMLSEQPIAPIYHYLLLHVFDPDKVKNLNPNPWGFRRLDQVSVVR